MRPAVGRPGQLASASGGNRVPVFQVVWFLRGCFVHSHFTFPDSFWSTRSHVLAAPTGVWVSEGPSPHCVDSASFCPRSCAPMCPRVLLLHVRHFTGMCVCNHGLSPDAAWHTVVRVADHCWAYWPLGGGQTAGVLLGGSQCCAQSWPHHALRSPWGHQGCQTL